MKEIRRRLLVIFGLGLLAIGAAFVFFDTPFPQLVLMAYFVLIVLLRRRYPEAWDHSIKTELSEEGIVRTRHGTFVEGIRWEDVDRIWIMTTNEGPFGEDFFWVFQGDNETGCLVPNDDAVKLGLYDYLKRYEGFDHRAVILASGCTDNEQFVCWERNTQGPAHKAA